MPRHVGRRVVWILPVLLLAPLTGCGAFDGDDTTASGRRTTAQIEVVEVRDGADVEQLVLVAEVPAGQTGCAIDPRANVTGDENSIFVQAVADTTVEDEAGTCAERESTEIQVDLPPIDDRSLVINSEPWAKIADGSTYQQCGAPFGCDPPPADRCAAPWIDYALTNVEIEPERTVTVAVCDGTWLALDVDAVATGCQPVDGQTPPEGCAGTGTHARWYFKFVDEQAGWGPVLASGTQGGCADVHAVVPEFPAALCQGLPPRL